MSLGYQIKIQNDIPQSDKKKIKEWCQFFIKRVEQNGGYWNQLTRGGHGGWGLKRGRFGYAFKIDKESGFKYVFRRISRNKRIFGIVKISDIIFEDNEKSIGENGNWCACSQCNGDRKISMNLNINQDFETFVTIGETS